MKLNMEKEIANNEQSKYMKCQAENGNEGYGASIKSQEDKSMTVAIFSEKFS